jgi:hypothetical protein
LRLKKALVLGLLVAMGPLVNGCSLADIGQLLVGLGQMLMGTGSTNTGAAAGTAAGAAAPAQQVNTATAGQSPVTIPALQAPATGSFTFGAGS